MAVMLRLEVLEANTVPGDAKASMRVNRLRFHARSSGPDSTTSAAPAIDRSKSAEPVSSSRARSTSTAPAKPLAVSIRPNTLALCTPSAAVCAARLRRVARTPPRARVSAIPGPIIPVPTTLAAANLVCDIAVILSTGTRTARIVTQLIMERTGNGKPVVFCACQKQALPGTIRLKTYATTRTGNRAGRRQGNPALSADQGTRQTGRPFRREVPHHRLRAEQLHQLGHLFHLRADAVPQPVAAAAPERGLAVRRPAEEPVHHSGAGADALGRTRPGIRERPTPSIRTST